MQLILLLFIAEVMHSKSKKSSGFTTHHSVHGFAAHHWVHGFTLVELLIVISIISILTVVGVVSYSTVLKNTRDAKRQTDLKIIQSALESYYNDQKYYPSTASLSVSSGFNQSFTNLTGASSAETTLKRTYLNVIPKDPSGAVYVYKSFPGENDTPQCVNPGACVRYCLYANGENISSPMRTPPCNDTQYSISVTSP